MPKYRLYLYGSHDGGKSYVYDTGLYNSDAPAGQGCLNPDPQQLPSLQSVIQYANAHGEQLREVHSVEEVNAICSGGVASPKVASPVFLPTPLDTGTTQYGSTTPLQLTPAERSTVAAAISPQLTPGTGAPTGSSVGQTGNPQVNTLYRFILEGPGGVDTGANYSGCSSVNSMMCDPRQFATLADAIAYSKARREIPYRVLSSNEPWGIIDGSINIDPLRILGGTGGTVFGIPIIPLAVGLGLLFLFSGKRGQ